MKKMSASNYQKDKVFPSIAKAVTEILLSGNVVTPVEVLLRLQKLRKQDYENWRFGRIPYLERACTANLSVLCRILRILALHMQAMGLRPSQTAYHKWGRGKSIVLRFSKSGDPNLEASYSRHYITKAGAMQNQPEIQIQ